MRSQTERSTTDASEFSRRAHSVIPGGAHTYSKGDDQLPVDAPAAFVRGKGSRVWDLDGREYVDWGMGINNVLVGHAEEEIDQAAIEALRSGQNLSRPTPLEVEAAEALLELFTGMDMVKFAKNGSDANEAAIRLARTVTGRDLIAYDAAAPFLSIHDWFIGKTTMNAGIPQVVTALAVPFQYNDAASVDRLFDEHRRRIAAVILEPARTVHPAPGFLERLRHLCDRDETLMIFDEMVTGFRYSLQGAASFVGVRPDLMTLGKGMANGYALSALLGKRDYMSRGGASQEHPRCFLLSTTNGAERSALAAGLSTMAFYHREPVVERLARVGKALITGLAERARAHGIDAYISLASDYPCRPALTCLDHDLQPSPSHRTLCLQQLLHAGVFMPWVCPSFRHGAREIDQTLEAFDRVCAVYARAIERRSVEGLLTGRPVKPVF